MAYVYQNTLMNRYGTAVLAKVVEIAFRLDINPSWLLCVFQQESTMNHQAVNPKSGATGFIQFMPQTALGLKTTTAALKAMSALEQLDYVYKYFAPYKSRLKQATDLYAVTFYPYMLTQPDSYVLGSQSSAAYAELVAKQNPIFDLNKDRKITKGEFMQYVKTHTFRDLPADEFKKKVLS